MAKKLTAMQKRILKDKSPNESFKKREDFLFDQYPDYALQLLLNDAINAMCQVLVKGGMQKKEMPGIKAAILDCLLSAPVDEQLITYDDNYEKKCRREFRQLTPKQIAAFDKWLEEFNEGEV